MTSKIHGHHTTHIQALHKACVMLGTLILKLPMIFQSPEFSVAYCQGCVYLSMKSNHPVIERFEDDLELD